MIPEADHESGVLELERQRHIFSRGNDGFRLFHDADTGMFRLALDADSRYPRFGNAHRF